MKICCLLKGTNICAGVYEIDNINDWVDHGDLVLAPNHNGDTGWELQADGTWKDPNAPSEEDLWTLFRINRDGLLAKSDVYMIPDFPISDEKRAEWVRYRQELRDLPESITDINNIMWPEKPS